MKNYRILSIVIIIGIFFSSIEIFAEEIGVIPEELLETIIEAGRKEGEIQGNKEGKKDYIKEYTSKWDRDINNELILIDYPESIDKDKKYKDEFVEAYKKAFKSAYEKAYDESKKEKEESNSSTIGGLGASLGMIHGEIDGFKDFESNSRSDWSRSIPRLSEMNRIFDLRKLPTIDRDTFITEFTKNYQIGYEKAYYAGHFGIKKDNKKNGRTDGTTFGTMLGKTFAIKDYHEGRTLDYNRNMPGESEIISYYSLNKDNQDYKEGFINGFKNSYQECYTNSYRESKNNIILLEDASAYENGNLVGQAKGKIQGNIDHMENRSNDWKRSEDLSSTIIIEYNLIYQTPKYRDGFISGYFDGYAQGYSEMYKKLTQTGAISKTTSETIPISGGVVESLEGGFSVEIDNGIYYKPIILTIDSLIESYNPGDRYISASSFYRLNMVNPSKEFAKDKKIKISFEYYGDEDGGIYELENEKWTYLTSVIEEGTIFAYVNPSTINSQGNVFGVLVDKETEVFHDIRGHWAKDEITAYIRRGVIKGYQDKAFKPDQYITRAEFLVLLSRLYEWYLPYDISNNEFFKDYTSFNKYSEKHISYSLSHEYIIGYPDKYFRPYNNISYKEVDIIMKKILKNPYFKWERYAEQMMYDKKVKSSSYNSYDNNITRAEFSYMLYKLNEWKY